MHPEPPFPVIMGPTASGKSALALELARSLGGEIISVDSMQVYRGLDIGTAKPTEQERREIPHHLIDILDIGERADLFTFRDKAEELIADIRSRGRLPIPAGGTGLYLRALVYGLDNMPADESLRQQINAEFDNDSGFETLKKIMREKVPDDFEKWHQHRRRLLRAYEVFLLTGNSFTSLQKTWKKAGPRTDAVQFVLLWEREELKRRIRERCRAMIANGWIEETENLAKQGLFSAPTAWQALGYPLIGEYLRGGFSLDELEERIVTATWQFARRQLTWFRGQHKEAIRLEMPQPMERLLERVVSELEKKYD